MCPSSPAWTCMPTSRAACCARPMRWCRTEPIPTSTWPPRGSWLRSCCAAVGNWVAAKPCMCSACPTSFRSMPKAPGWTRPKAFMTSSSNSTASTTPSSVFAWPFPLPTSKSAARWCGAMPPPPSKRKRLSTPCMRKPASPPNGNSICCHPKRRPSAPWPWPTNPIGRWSLPTPKTIPARAATATPPACCTPCCNKAWAASFPGRSPWA